MPDNTGDALLGTVLLIISHATFRYPVRRHDVHGCLDMVADNWIAPHR
jgi:hypothetical protein